MNKMFYDVLPGVYVCIKELIILLFSSFHNFQQVVMETTLKETKSSLEQLEKEHLALKDIVHRITTRIEIADDFPVAGNKMPLMAVIGRKTGWERENVRSHIVNTETLHMYALSVTRKCATSHTKWGRVWSWVMSSISLIIVCSQMIVLLSLLKEGESPTCTSHTDCFGGLFCNANIFSDEAIQPRCADCRHLIDLDIIHKNECTVMMPGWQYIEEVEENVIWFDKSSEPHIKELNISNLDENKKNIMSKCLVWKHCGNTKIALLYGFSEYTRSRLFLKIKN